MSDLFEYFNSIGYNSKEFKNIDHNSVRLTDKVKERWYKLGLLDSLDGETKDKCVLSFERFAVYMINEYRQNKKKFKTKDEENLWLGLSLSVILQIVKVTGIVVNPENIMSGLYDISYVFTKDILSEMEKRFYGRLAFEAELTVLISKYIIGEMVLYGEYKLSKIRKKD